MDIYYKCEECGQIEIDAEWIKIDEKFKCMHCEKVGRRVSWPSAEIRGLFDHVCHLEHTSPEYGLISIVFVSAALELLLERLIYIVAIENFLYEEVEHFIELLLDTNQGRARRIELYKHLAYDSFEVEARKVGYNQFMEHWNTIAEIRNKILHGNLKMSQDVDRYLIETTISEALPVFSVLNNKYNAESLRYGIARESVEKKIKELEKLRIWKEAGNRNTKD